MPLFSSIFLTFWLGVIGLVFMISIEALIGPSFVRWTSPSAPWEAALFSAMLLAFAVGLLIFGRILAKDEHEYLIGFIEDNTNASVVFRGSQQRN
jgi:hypothetical protein